MERVCFLSPRQVEAITSLSPRHQSRLAQEDRFPKPVRLGEGKNGRIGFVEAEVLAWNAARLEERNAAGKPVNGAETDAVEAPSAAAPPASVGRPNRQRPAGRSGRRRPARP
jgi:predicted DNA-binding transcriptional regulator AlpA